MNKLLYSDELADEYRSQHPANHYTELWRHIQAQLLAEYPMYLGIIDGVTYDSKTDRYVIKFGKSSAKINNEAAQYLLTWKDDPMVTTKPTIYAHMADGIIDRVAVLFLSRRA